MISVTKLRNGVTFLLDGQPLKVVKYTHTHISRGSGTIKVKVKNLKNGSVSDKTFKSGEKVDDLDISRKKMQFLYKDGDEYLFMNVVDFSQLSLGEKSVGETGQYLKDGEEYNLAFWHNPKSDKEEPLDIDLPMKLNYKVTEAAPGVKGDTQGAATKDAILENGLKVRVPLFVKKGDMVRVDTRTGDYVERVS
ncbi:elongation factor P [Patescibacteria group bacterium]